MAAGLPFLKLAGLLVKTLAKPVANRLKIEASKRKNISEGIQVLGQSIHQITSRFNVLASGYSFIGVKPLSPEEAIGKGVNFLSEFFVFSVAGGIIIEEYYRGEAKNAEKARKAAEKEAVEKAVLEERFESITQRLVDLEEVVVSQSNENVRLHQEIRRLMALHSEESKEKKPKSWLSSLFI